MKLSTETYKKGMKFLASQYLNWKFDFNNKDMVSGWYATLSSVISEENFTPLIFHYCQSQPAPNGPSDLLNFGKTRCIDNSPSPAVVAHTLVDSVDRVLHNHIMYESPTVEQKKQQLLCDIVMYYPTFREDCVYTAIVVLVNDWYVVIEDTIQLYDPTALSILKSELKTAYCKELQKSVSHVAISGSLLETSSSLLLEG